MHKETGLNNYLSTCANGKILPSLDIVLYRTMFLPPATKLRQGNVFTPVCDSVQAGSLSRGGLCPGGVSVRRSLSRGVSVRKTPLPPYGYVRAVRILLECILLYVVYLENQI